MTEHENYREPGEFGEGVTVRRAEPADILETYIELNMSNYDQDDVERQNAWAIDAYGEIERLRNMLSRAEEYVIDGVTNAKAEAEMNAPYPARAPRYDAALAEVRQLYADIQAALAATRSASAINASGTSHD